MAVRACLICIGLRHWRQKGGWGGGEMEIITPPRGLPKALAYHCEERGKFDIILFRLTASYYRKIHT